MQPVTMMSWLRPRGLKADAVDRIVDVNLVFVKKFASGGGPEMS